MSKCKKCGGVEHSIHLREVAVTIGWSSAVIKTVAPCTMCQRCGDLTVATEVAIGKFMNLVPGSSPPPSGERMTPAPAQPVEPEKPPADVVEMAAHRKDHAAEK